MPPVKNTEGRPICTVKGCRNYVHSWKAKDGIHYSPFCQKHKHFDGPRPTILRGHKVKDEQEWRNGERVCMVVGCQRLGIKSSSGKRRNICEFHARSYDQHEDRLLKKRAWTHTSRMEKRANRDNKQCERCGWRGACQRHRILPGKDGGEYVEGNVEVLCPNCHFAAHGHGAFNQQQRY